MPKNHGDAAWYHETAKKTLAVIVQKWEAGEDLSNIHPTLTLDDLLPAPGN